MAAAAAIPTSRAIMTRLKLGLEVAWQHTFYLQGRPESYMKRGKVEVLRKDSVVVRTVIGRYLVEVPKSELYVMNFNKPRRSGNLGWHKLDT